MDRDALRQTLLLEKARLLVEVNLLDAELAESLEDASEESIYDQHMAEIAGITLDREVNLSLEENTMASLKQIERALKKLENSSFGKCDRCGLDIGEDRLKTAPSATMCIDCKRIEERER